MKVKKMIAIILTLVTILSMGLFTTVNADEKQTNKINITAEEEAQLVAFFHENGVDDKTADKLIKKFENGIMWDSFKEEYKNMEPASVTESNGTIIKKYVYPDGSIKVVSIITPTNDGDVSIQGVVSGGTWISGSGYRTCIGAYVSFNYGIHKASFYADFTLVDNGYDYISGAYNPQAGIIGGTVSDMTLTITRASETAYQPAEARLQYVATLFGGWASNITWLSLSVGNNTYSSDNN